MTGGDSMKKRHIAIIALTAVALISGAFWSAMAISAERGMRELDMDWWQ